eukprot:135546_1
MNTGSYTWKITDQLVIKRIYNADFKQAFGGDMFEIGKLKWQLILYPNGFSEKSKGSFMICIKLIKMPKTWKKIITNRTSKCVQTTTSNTNIHTTQFFQPTTPSPTTEGCINIDVFPDVHEEDIHWILKGLDTNGRITTTIHIQNNTGKPPLCIHNSNNDSCLEFSIYDSFGDGLLYGKGTWNIAWYGETWSSISKGNYHHSETFQFCQSFIYQNEEATIIDVVVSIIDDTNSLDFVMVFLDQIIPMFDKRIKCNLVFTNIVNRMITNVKDIPVDNLDNICIHNNNNDPIYCSKDGVEAIIDALAVLCIWNSTNQTLFDEFQDYWGDSTASINFTLAVPANESYSFKFLQDDCDYVELEYNYEKEFYTLISGVELLNKSFLFFEQTFDIDGDYGDYEDYQINVPQIGGVHLDISSASASAS